MNTVYDSLHGEFALALHKKFTDAVKEYRLFKSGDKVYVNVSGGVNSLLAAALLTEYERHGNIPIKAFFLADSADIAAFCAEFLNPERIIQTAESKENCFGNEVITDCFDDVIEDILAGVLFEGRSAVKLSKEPNGAVRPLYKIRRRDIDAWGRAAFPRGKIFERERSPETLKAADIIERLNQKNPQVCQNVFRALCTVRLDHIISYVDENGIQHNFLDNYNTQP